MTAAAPTPVNRHNEMLSGLAEMAYALAERMQAKAMAAETAEEAERYAGAFHKAARSARMSIALEAKAQRDARAEARTEAQANAAAEAAADQDDPTKIDRIIRLVMDRVPGVDPLAAATGAGRESEGETERAPPGWYVGSVIATAMGKYRPDEATKAFNDALEAAAKAVRQDQARRAADYGPVGEGDECRSGGAPGGGGAVHAADSS